MFIPSQDLTDKEKSEKRRRIEMDLVSDQSEYSKLLRKKQEQEIETRRLQQDLRRMEMRMQDAEKVVKESDKKLYELDARIQKRKKELNVLR